MLSARLVTGQLRVPLYQTDHIPGQGIEPVKGIDPQGQGLQPDVPAAEVGQLMEEGVVQSISRQLILGQQENGLSKPASMGTFSP